MADEEQKEQKMNWSCLYCDGASRGNPGWASIGAVLFLPGVRQPAFEISECIGKATNNVAEYAALIAGLEKSLAKNFCNIKIFLDSELLVRQLLGIYRVKNAGLQASYAKAKKLMAHLSDYKVCHIPRSKNQHADALANRALDQQRNSKFL